MPRFVFARDPQLERSWPFLHRRLVERLGALGEVEVVALDRGAPLGEHADLGRVDAVALFGGQLTEGCVARAPALKAVGCNTDNTGRPRRLRRGAPAPRRPPAGTPQRGA